MQLLAWVVIIIIVAIPVIAFGYVLAKGIWEDKERILSGCTCLLVGIGIMAFIASAMAIAIGEDNEVPTAKPIFVAGLVIIARVGLWALYIRIK